MKFSILKLTPFATTNRVREIKDGSTGLVNYVHRGIKSTVSIQYVEPEITMTYLRQSGSGDRYTGLDRFNRIADIPWRKSGSDVEHYQYGFDRAGNRTWRANVVAAAGSHAFDEGYAYDGLYQLNDLKRGVLNSSHIISGPPAWEEQFAYDATGNWDNYTTKVDGSETLDQDRTHDPANEILTIDGSGTNVSYDGVGNMTRMPFAGWSDHRNLIWDAWNRLVKIMDGDEEVAIYRYDALTRRIEKFCAEGGTWVHRHFYYSDQWQVLEERLNTTTTAERQFVWGMRYTDDLVLRDRFDAPASSSSSGSSSSSSTTERLYATHDQWHVTAITDAAGSVVERYAYEAFGNTIVLAPNFDVHSGGTDYEWETRFAAYRWDWGSKLYQVRYRYLHPGLGRWISRDPIGEVSGQNLYVVSENAPTDSADFDGRMTGPLAALIAVGIVAACAYPQYMIAQERYPDSDDKFKHCWVSCRISKSCGGVVAQLAGLAKEARDRLIAEYCKRYPHHEICIGDHGDFWDSLDDLVANQQCVGWETYPFGPIGGWIGALCRRSCEDCCKEKVGYNSANDNA